MFAAKGRQIRKQKFVEFEMQMSQCSRLSPFDGMILLSVEWFVAPYWL